MKSSDRLSRISQAILGLGVLCVAIALAAPAFAAGGGDAHHGEPAGDGKVHVATSVCDAHRLKAEKEENPHYKHLEKLSFHIRFVNNY